MSRIATAGGTGVMADGWWGEKRVIGSYDASRPHHPITLHLITLRRDFALYSLDEPVHAEELFIGHGLAFRHADRASLVCDWSGEDRVDGFLAALEAGDIFLDGRANIVRHEVGDRSQIDDAV